MDNMAEAYVVLFVYGVFFAIVGVISLLQMLVRMALFERAGVVNCCWQFFFILNLG